MQGNVAFLCPVYATSLWDLARSRHRFPPARGECVALFHYSTELRGGLLNVGGRLQLSKPINVPP